VYSYWGIHIQYKDC